MGMREALAYKLLGVKASRFVETCTIEEEASLRGKCVLITGGTSGIGLATASKCIKCGANVVVTGHNAEKLKIAANHLGKDAAALLWDHRDASNTNKKLDAAESLLGGHVDCLFVNAGVYIDHRATTYDSDEFDQVIDINLRSAFFLISEQVSRWIGNGRGGVVLATGSNRGMFADTGPYGLSKAALHSFIQGIARENGSRGIRANVVAPGMTATEINGVDPSGDLGLVSDRVFRVIRPEEIAEVAAFLLSDRSICVNGAVVPCDLGDNLR